MALRLATRLNLRLLWSSSLAQPLKLGRSVLVTSLTLTGLILSLRHFGLLQGVELATYDQMMQLQPDEGEDKRLLVVGITEDDLQTLQEWPISDRTIAQLLKKLEANQPHVIGLDVMRDIPAEPGRKELLNQLNQSQRTIVVCKVSAQNDPGTSPPKGVSNPKVGFADLIIDSGGILRRSLLLATPPSPSGLSKIRPHLCSNSKQTLSSLSFYAAKEYLEREGIKTRYVENTIQIGTTRLPPFTANLGSYRGVDAGGYQMLLRYRSSERVAKQVSLTEVLNNQVPPALIRDRIVLIGYTTPLAKDDFYTPYSAGKQDRQKMPGVIVHAQATSQILAAVLDNRPLIWVWGFPIEAAWILSCAAIGVMLAWYLRHPVHFSLVVATASGGIYLIGLVVFTQGGWIPVVPGIMACIGSAVGVVLFDRFNHSAYGQSVYKKVKTLLKLDVEIDEQRLEQQVAEITETDYFRDLQNTVKSLRSQQTPDAMEPSQVSLQVPVQHRAGSEAETSAELNQSQLLEPDLLTSFNFDPASRSLPEPLFPPENPGCQTEETDDGLIDYLNDIKQESQRLKEAKSADS